MSRFPAARRIVCALSAAMVLGSGFARADGPVATVKNIKGAVSVERDAKALPATIGMPLLQSDQVVTGADGSAGITFADNALLSLGPSSRLSIDTFRFDPTTYDGDFQTTLAKGKMAVVSGKIAKHHLDAMKVRTPTSVLGVRGTEFLVEAGE